MFLVSNAEFYLRNWVTWGFLCYFLVFVVFVIFSQRKISFIEVLEHEVIHATVAMLLFWKDIQELRATPEGGTTAYYESSNAIIRVAPYCIPLITVPLVAIKFFVSSSVQGAIIDFLIGFTLAFHLFALRKEFRLDQPDIQKAGHLFSLSVVCLMNSILVVIVICMVSGHYSNIPDYFADSLARAQEFYGVISETLTTLRKRIA